MAKEIKTNYTEKDKLELGINKYVDSWFDGLVKSWKTENNKDSLKKSYYWIAKQAVKVYLEEQKLNENFCVGDVLVSDRFKNAENFPRVFKASKVDNKFGVIYYKYKDIEDSVGIAYVRRAKFWERIFLWIMN